MRSEENNKKLEQQSDNVIKIEVVYQPGPLEKLFGQIGKCFNAIFDQKGTQIERPVRKNKNVKNLHIILPAADL